MSVDKGSTWRHIFAQNDILSIATDSKDRVFSGASSGRLYHSADRGETWTEQGEGLSHFSVTRVAIASDGIVFAGTDGGGVFRSVEPSATPIERLDEELPPRFFLHQNYPNPFYPGTTIPFMLERSTEVTVEIFDVLGRRVATLLSGRLPAGAHTIAWDAEGLPGGVYVYRLQTGRHARVKKMVLMR